jgi:hypothetical protein
MTQLKKNHSPGIPTVKGKAEAATQDAEQYQRHLEMTARADVYEAVRQGLDDVSRGRTMPANEVFERFAESMESGLAAVAPGSESA